MDTREFTEPFTHEGSGDKVGLKDDVKKTKKKQETNRKKNKSFSPINLASCLHGPLQHPFLYLPPPF